MPSPGGCYMSYRRRIWEKIINLYKTICAYAKKHTKSKANHKIFGFQSSKYLISVDYFIKQRLSTVQISSGLVKIMIETIGQSFHST